MARQKKHTIKSEKGKEYEYARVTRVVGKRQNKRGEWVSVQKVFYGKTKAEAIAKAEAYINRNELTRDKNFAQLITWWIDNIYMRDSTLADSTKSLHISAYHNIFDDSMIIGKPIEDINGADIQAVITSSSVAPSTKRHAKSFLTRFYKYLISQKVCTSNMAESIVIQKPERKNNNQRVEVFTDEELKKFLSDTPKEHRLRLLIILAIYTGARIGELLALKYEDIENGHVIIDKALKEINPVNEEGKTRVEVSETKTRSSIRTLELEPHEFIQAEINQHKVWHTREMIKKGYRTDYIFTTENGALYFKSNIRRAFTRLCKQIGVEYKSFHTFRHTFGTRLARAGEPIITVSKLMGHDSIDTTGKYYIDVSEESRRNALKKLAL